MPIRPIFIRRHYTYPRTPHERTAIKKLYKRAIGVTDLGNGQEFIVKNGRFHSFQYPEIDELLEVVNAYVSKMMASPVCAPLALDDSSSSSSDSEEKDNEDSPVPAPPSPSPAPDDTGYSSVQPDDCSLSELNHSLRKFIILADEFIIQKKG